jgi:hypothetical protein
MIIKKDGRIFIATWEYCGNSYGHFVLYERVLKKEVYKVIRIFEDSTMSSWKKYPYKIIYDYEFDDKERHPEQFKANYIRLVERYFETLETKKRFEEMEKETINL